jgi:4-amino-4-deoxy-L-arabinose transferase-like glycosyltransferase
VAILIAAFLLRVLHLADIPWLFTGDEGSAGLSAVAFLQGRHNNVFVMGAGSFPALYHFLESLTIRLFGQTIVAARLPSALAGASTILGLYAFARRAFGRPIAFASAAYLTTFPMHIQFSRTGLNNIWDSLTLVVVSATLWLAWERNHPAFFAAAGLALGLGQYFYPTSHLLCGAVVVWLVAASFFDRARLRERLPALGVMVLAFLTSALPLVLFYGQHPDEFTAPFARVSILGTWMQDAIQQGQGSVWSILWSQLRASALAFANLPLRGCYAGAPMLLPVAAGLFYLGAVVAALHLPALQHAWVLICLAAAVATGMFSVETPSSQRYLFTTPFVALLVVLPIVSSVRWLGGIWPRLRRPLLPIGVLCIAALISADLRYYFGTYTGGRLFGDRNTEVATRVAEYIGEHPPGIHVYFAGLPRMGYFTHRTISFLAPDSVGEDIPMPLTSLPEFDLAGPTAFIVLPERESDLDYVRSRYPDGSLQAIYGKWFRLLFWAYLVNGP